VLGDSIYGSDRKLRRMLQARGLPYFLAVRSNEPLRVGGGSSLQGTNPESLADDLPPNAWFCHAAGKEPKARGSTTGPACASSGHRTRNGNIGCSSEQPKNLDERAYYICFAPAGTALAELAGVGGLRWTIETCFETAKDELGLDHCEARSWHAWHRHISLVMTALAFLAKLRADLLRATVTDASQGKRNERSPRPVVLAS
jgi:SRSO17 transposase